MRVATSPPTAAPWSAVQPPPNTSARTHFPHPLVPAQLLAPFRPLASGGFGVTFACVDDNSKIEVCVKVMRIRAPVEVAIMQHVRHDAIIRIYRSFSSGTYHGIVMQLSGGQDLCNTLIARSAPFSESEARVMLLQLCHALQYLHGQGIIHRDVKPENIMVDETGILTLIDFGSSKWGGWIPDTATRLMRFATTTGTWAYVMFVWVCVPTAARALPHARARTHLRNPRLLTHAPAIACVRPPARAALLVNP